MSLHLKILLCSLLIVGICYSQKFSLKGIINADSGIIRLMPVSIEDFYKYTSINETEIKIKEGKFSCNGTLKHITAYKIRLEINNKLEYISGTFYLDSGLQNITINKNEIRKTPKIINKPMIELESNFQPLLDSIKTKNEQFQLRIDSIKKHTVSNNTNEIESLKNEIEKNEYLAILNYVKKHTKSYIAFWYIIEKSISQFSPYLDSIYTSFHNTLKKDNTGKMLLWKIQINKTSSNGSMFPTLLLKDNILKSVNLNVKNIKSRFILIDFWFSHCNPCISQFDYLNTIYKKYLRTQFEIIGISVDKKTEILDWKKIIREKKIDWIQFIDQGGLYAKKLGIENYPTNFLLDNRTGKIIQKNISIEDLNTYLESNLK